MAGRLSVALLAGLVMLWGALAAAAPPLDQKAQLDRIISILNQRFPEVQTITAHKAASTASGQKPLFIDVRTKEEQAISMLPGAITIQDFINAQNKYQHKTKVLYCTIGLRSAQVAMALKMRGVSAQSLAGGMLAWVSAGGEIRDAKGPTKRFYVTGGLVPLLAPGYQAVP